MGAWKKQIAAVSDDVLQGEVLAEVPSPGAFCDFYACTQTITDSTQLFHGSVTLTNAFTPNLRADADAGPLVSDDAVFEGMWLPPGRLRLPVNALTAQMGLHLVIRKMPGT